MTVVLITGAAGFIGFHAAQTCLAKGWSVIGFDNLNDYYDVALKTARLNELQQNPNFIFHRGDLANITDLEAAVSGQSVTHILHLAAQAGVRYSLENPRAYADSNLLGHLNVLELARSVKGLEHLVYASSSSVYGERSDGPFVETDEVRSPTSLYAATKISGEMLAQSYAYLYGIAQTGLRFFTVYGPWGRPDMAYFKFTQSLINNQPLTLFSPDTMLRDFTYVDDIVGVIPKILKTPPNTGHAIYNLGNSRPQPLMALVNAIETACNVSGTYDIQPRQNGDVTSTFASIDTARHAFGFEPMTTLNDGIPIFVDWFRRFYDCPE